jgi:hypothetical protein
MIIEPGRCGDEPRLATTRSTNPGAELIREREVPMVRGANSNLPKIDAQWPEDRRSDAGV